MAESKKTELAEPAPTHDDLVAARGKLQELLGASEADQDKVHRSKLKRQRAETRLKQQGVLPEEMHLEDLPEVYPGDPEVHRALHASHQVIATIEKSLGINQPPAPRDK